MRRITGLMLCAAAILVAEGDLSQVRSVYILPMSNGLDHYLANQLSHGAPVRIVADPQQADAVFTDRLGEQFETRMDELYNAKAAKKNNDEDKPVRVNSMGRGRGNIFLVDRKTRTLLWSTYDRPKNGSPDGLNRTARDVAREFSKAYAGRPAAK